MEIFVRLLDIRKLRQALVRPYVGQGCWRVIGRPTIIEISNSATATQNS